MSEVEGLVPNFSVDELTLEDVYFKHVNHTLSISVNVIEDYIRIVALSEFLKTFTLTASVKNVCDSIEKHLDARKRRGYVEDENKYKSILPPKYEWMQHLHIVLDYESSTKDRRRKILRLLSPPRPTRVNMVRDYGDDDDEGTEGAEGRGRVISRTIVAADEEIEAVKAEEVLKAYPEVKENHAHYNEIEVIFNEGKLGLRLRNRRKHRPGVIIDAFVSIDDEGTPGPAEKCGVLKPLMRIISVNSQDVSEMTFEDVIHLIEIAKRPLNLHFAPPVNADVHPDLDGDMLQMAMEAAHRPLLEEKYAEDPDDLKVAKSLAYTLYADADFKNAVHLLKKIEREDKYNEYKDARFWCMLGRSCAKLWSTNHFLTEIMLDAKESYEKAITFEENALNPAIWHEMAQVYIDYGAVAGAAQLYAKIIEEFPDYVRLNEVVWTAGSILRHLNMHKDAIPYFMYSLEKPPREVHRHDIALELGRCLSRQGKRSAAVSAYKRAFDMYREKESLEAGQRVPTPLPRTLDAQTSPSQNIKRLSKKSQEEDDRIQAEANKIADRQEFVDWVSSPNTWVDVGQRHEDMNNIMLAIDSYRQALKLSDERDVSVWWLLAKAYYKIHQMEDAINCCINILAINPYHRQAIEARYAWEAEFEVASMQIGREHIQAATGIQSAFRARKARKRVENVRQEKREQASAATRIQATFRQKQARKEVKKKREKRKAEDKKRRQDPLVIIEEKKRQREANRKKAQEKKLKRERNLARIQQLKKQQEESLKQKKARKHSWTNISPRSSSGSTVSESERGDFLSLSQATSKKVDANPEFTAAMADWQKILENALSLYPSAIEMQKCVKDVCVETSILRDEAFCALASNNGSVAETLEALKEAEFFNSVRTACNVFDVKAYARGEKGVFKVKYPANIRMDRVAEGAALPNVSLPQWTPDRRVLKKSELTTLPSLSEYERKILEQDFSNRRLMAGNGLKGGVPKKNSYSMEKAIEYHMLAYEARHLRAWQRAKHADLLHQEISSPKKLTAGKASTESLGNIGFMSGRLQRQPSKLRIRNKRSAKAKLTPPRDTFDGIPSSLGHDGVIPVLKTARWSRTKHLELRRKGIYADRIRRQVALSIDRKLQRPPLLDPLLEASFSRSVVL